MMSPPPSSPLFPYTTLFRSRQGKGDDFLLHHGVEGKDAVPVFVEGTAAYARLFHRLLNGVRFPRLQHPLRFNRLLDRFGQNVGPYEIKGIFRMRHDHPPEKDKCLLLIDTLYPSSTDASRGMPNGFPAAQNGNETHGKNPTERMIAWRTKTNGADFAFRRKCWKPSPGSPPARWMESCP